ncbi:PDR/VanB family oxidoreductase [Poseidonocella sp. HB161398]|uniref:PDR/VanB family oxidoreductase n=1 Tax=Poseidonocella sp. HB161398 TaxID=2320855 RepID=UPI001108360E|nr:PDR/VanB family oxidoreductase [Poseidonocella sp. HB161398]
MIDVTITRRETQGRDIVVLDLAAADGAPLPAFEAGAHIDVEIAPGLTRQYSLCGDPAEHGRYRIGVLKDAASRGGSAAIHDGFAQGQTVRIGAPRNLFPLDAGAPGAVLLGGGIGVTPMIAMAHALHAAGTPFTLHYFARELAGAAFLDELAQLPFAAAVTLHSDAGEATPAFDPATDLPAPGSGAHVYICGPAGFMEHMEAQARAGGFAPGAIHREFFSAAPDAQGGSFELELARSGRTIEVAEGQTIVAALAAIGIKVDVSCEQGICGTCLCDVLEGEPDHRDSFLTGEERAEGDQMMLCCSRAKTPRLVIDL